MENRILKWAFFAFTISVFCAIWPNTEQPKVQLLVYQIGGILFWAACSVSEELRKSPKEQIFALFLVGFSLLVHKSQSSFNGFSQAFLASVLYYAIATKVERKWIVDALFVSAILQLPIALGQLDGYDPIFNYKLAEGSTALAKQATGFIGKRSELCVFLAVVSMLKLENKNFISGLLLNVFVFIFRGIAGMGGIMASWLLWASKKGIYIFSAIFLACLCVLAPQAGYIIQTKSTVRLLVWKPFFDASFGSIYVGHGLFSTKTALPVLIPGGWGTAWTEIKNSFLTIFFEMGILGIAMLYFLFRRALFLFKEPNIPTSFYAFVVLAFSSFFLTTHFYPSLAYLWILVLALVHIDFTERRKDAA